MIAFLSNINIEPIKNFFKEEEVFFSGYNQFLIDLLNDNSDLYSNKISEVFLFIDLEEMLYEIFNKLPTEETFSEADEKLNNLFSLVKSYLTKRNNVIFVMNNATKPINCFTTFIESNHAEVNFSVFVNTYNDKLKILKKEHSNLLIFDWERIVRTFGENNLYDDKFWYLGRIKLNNNAYKNIKEEYTSLLNAYRGKIKKVLVLDLDNTIWGGVIGEDGVNGIILSEDGPGKAYRDFQKIILSLKDIGVILALNSKNNVTDVEEVFSSHNMMVLQYDDFVIKKINWENKAQNLVEIADELNLGMDSIVFIDDNPVEREFVKKNLPVVTVPDYPPDISKLKKWFFTNVVYKYFPKISLTNEDKTKTRQYVSNIKRNELGKNLTLNDFLKGLEIKLKVYVNPTSFNSRIAQLTQKTNQFNMTTRRYTEGDIENFIADKDISVFAIEYSDKFNSEGIVGTAFIKLQNEEIKIDTFLMSCRIIGKSIEFIFLYEILCYFEKKNIRKVIAEFIPTKKNIVGKNFYGNCGFEKTIENEFESDYSNLLLELKNKYFKNNIKVEVIE